MGRWVGRWVGGLPREAMKRGESVSLKPRKRPMRRALLRMAGMLLGEGGWVGG